MPKDYAVVTYRSISEKLAAYAKLALPAVMPFPAEQTGIYSARPVLQVPTGATTARLRRASLQAGAPCAVGASGAPLIQCRRRRLLDLTVLVRLLRRGGGDEASQ